MKYYPHWGRYLIWYCSNVSWCCELCEELWSVSWKCSLWQAELQRKKERQRGRCLFPQDIVGAVSVSTNHRYVRGRSIKKCFSSHMSDSISHLHTSIRQKKPFLSYFSTGILEFLPSWNVFKNVDDSCCTQGCTHVHFPPDKRFLLRCWTLPEGCAARDQTSQITEQSHNFIRWFGGNWGM